MFYHTTCDTLPSSAANQGDNTVRLCVLIGIGLCVLSVEILQAENQ